MQIVKYKASNGQWYWRLRADNGRIVADGAEGYASERNGDRAIASIQGMAEAIAGADVSMEATKAKRTTVPRARSLSLGTMIEELARALKRVD